LWRHTEGLEVMDWWLKQNKKKKLSPQKENRRESLSGKWFWCGSGRWKGNTNLWVDQREHNPQPPNV
jgi:hypothetical protein